MHSFVCSSSLQSGIEVSKKARKELHNLVMTWGLPPPAEGADIEAPPAAADGAEGAAAADAVLRASDYDWDSWAGRAAEVPVALRRVGDDELTVMLQVSALYGDSRGCCFASSGRESADARVLGSAVGMCGCCSCAKYSLCGKLFPG
jgi:hypothetical protein